MPTYFWMRFESFRPYSTGVISVDLTLEHNTRRVARIYGAEFELWLGSGSTGRFLARLGPDVRGDVMNPTAQLLPEFKDTQKSSCRLLWHYTAEQLQEVEDARGGGNAVFYVYAHLIVQATWQQLNEPASSTHEVEAPGHERGWPLLVEIAESDWVTLLSQIGFKHPVMDRIPWPSLPPAFSRAQSNLNDAWNYYRRGDPDGALTSCYKAFECLGFDLFGKEVARKAVLDLLMGSAEPEKQQAVLDVLRSLQNVFQFGRHDKRAPVSLTQNDAQMAVVCATALLAYLGKSHSA